MSQFFLPKPIGTIEVPGGGVEAAQKLREHLMAHYEIPERQANALIFNNNLHAYLNIYFDGNIELAEIYLRDAICKISKYSNHPKSI